MQKCVSTGALFAISSGGRCRPKVQWAWGHERRVLNATISPCTWNGHPGIGALRYSNRSRASCLDDLTYEPAQLAALVSFSVLIPTCTTCRRLLGELGEDDLVHHGHIALRPMPAPDIEEPVSFQTQRPECLLPILREAIVCQPSLHSFGGPLRGVDGR